MASQSHMDDSLTETMCKIKMKKITGMEKDSGSSSRQSTPEHKTE